MEDNISLNFNPLSWIFESWKYTAHLEFKAKELSDIGSSHEEPQAKLSSKSKWNKVGHDNGDR